MQLDPALPDPVYQLPLGETDCGPANQFNIIVRDFIQPLYR